MMGFGYKSDVILCSWTQSFQEHNMLCSMFNLSFEVFFYFIFGCFSEWHLRHVLRLFFLCRFWWLHKYETLCLSTVVRFLLVVV